MLYLDESYNEREIELRTGEEFEIRLPENPTTGFRWYPISSGEPVCILLDNSFEEGRSSPGNSGSHFWHFQAVHEGLGKIEFASRRSWEQAKPPAQSFTLSIYVQT